MVSAVVGIGISGALAIDVAMPVAIAQTSITVVSIRVSRALAIKIAMAIEPESVALGSKVIGSGHLLSVGVVWGHSTIRVKHQQTRISLSLTLANDHRDLDGVSALTETSLLLCISVVRGDGPRRFGDNQTSLGQTDSRDDGCSIQTMVTIQAIVGLSLSLSLA